MNRLLTLALAFTLSCSPALPTTPVTAAEAEAVPEGTWAGKTSDENTFVALVSGAGQLQVYFCDGTTDAWLRGAISSPTARGSATFPHACVNRPTCIDARELYPKSNPASIRQGASTPPMAAVSGSAPARLNPTKIAQG